MKHSLCIFFIKKSNHFSYNLLTMSTDITVVLLLLNLHDILLLVVLIQYTRVQSDPFHQYVCRRLQWDHVCQNELMKTVRTDDCYCKATINYSSDLLKLVSVCLCGGSSIVTVRRGTHEGSTRLNGR